MSDEALTRILIVDDEENIRHLLRLAFEDGFEVQEAVDGLDALEKCNINIPDAIIVDWEMPRMNGVEFITQFKFIKEVSILIFYILQVVF